MRAREVVCELIAARRDEVFFSRQLEVLLENEFFHWITNRAVNQLVEAGELQVDERALATGGRIRVLAHRSNRYWRRAAKSLVALVDEYSDPNIGAALGLHGEQMVLAGIAAAEFVLKGKETRSYEEAEWTRTAHDLDFVFEKDGLAYGVEVKNKLGYPDRDELPTKVELCDHIGVTPVFVARMMPKSWIEEIRQLGGFSLIYKWQLYPWTHGDLAKRVRERLGLPVDAPRALEDGTVWRFARWHEGRV